MRKWTQHLLLHAALRPQPTKWSRCPLSSWLAPAEDARNFCDQLLFDLDGLWEDSIERIESDCMERFIYALATGDATGADAHGPKMRSRVLASSSAHAILERSAYRQAESNTRRCLSR